MIPLLMAVALCLLVPWLPVLIYRRLPRRPPPPLSQEQLHRLAAQFRRPDAEEFVEVTLVEDDALTADVSRQPEPDAGHTPPPARGRPPARPLPRLSLGSYRWLNALMAPVIIVTFLILAVGWALLFEYLGAQRAGSFPVGEFFFKPFSYGIVCAVPALFLGILSSLPLLMLLARLLLGRRRFLEYLFWDEGRLGPGSADRAIKVVSGLALVVSVVSAVWIGLVLNWYARFNEDQIAIKRLLAVGEEVHRYGDVVQIVVTSHRQMGKEIVPAEDVGLRFRDGRTWSTGQTFPPPSNPFERDRFLDFLQRKTGKPITRVRLLKDAPGW
jgi:hypothetical protein